MKFLCRDYFFCEVFMTRNTCESVVMYRIRNILMVDKNIILLKIKVRSP